MGKGGDAMFDAESRQERFRFIWSTTYSKGPGFNVSVPKGLNCRTQFINYPDRPSLGLPSG